MQALKHKTAQIVPTIVENVAEAKVLLNLIK